MGSLFLCFLFYLKNCPNFSSKTEQWTKAKIKEKDKAYLERIEAEFQLRGF